MELVALIIGTVTTSLIALFVLAKDYRSITNQLFACLAAGLVGWSATTYLSLHTSSDEQALFWIRWIMFFVVLQNTSFMLLVRVFPRHRYNLWKRKYVLAVLYSVVTAAVAVSPFLFVDFDVVPVPGPGMVLFLPHALIFGVGSLIALVLRYRKAYGSEKTQLLYFLLGTLLMFTVVPVGNFILPLAFKVNVLVPFSSLYAIVFSGLIAYGIVSKRLFDIKAAVARSVAYLLSLGFIGIVYGAFIVMLTSAVSLQTQNATVERGIYVGFALLTALLFEPLKRNFARFTNKIFYQDAYEPQQFLDNLNRVLVAKVDIDQILTEAASIIVDNLKSDDCIFTIRKTAYYPTRTLGTKSKLFDSDDMQVLHDHLPKMRQRVIILEDLTAEQNDLRKLMGKHDISVLVRLVTTVEYEVEGLGYLSLGPKKSGNPYSRQDEDIIRIIASSLAIAVENSLRLEEIQNFNVTLQEKVDNATKELRKSNEKLQALDEAKDEFISMASHQLRTPLTSVKGYVSMVLEGDAGPIKPAQAKLLEQAFTSSQRMVYLIADLLNVSRLKTGKFVIESKPTNLAEVVATEVDQLKATASARNLKLHYTKPKHCSELILDETKIRQVIMNFIDNAIYYTPSGGEITIELTETDNSLAFAVTDNGIGVPKNEQHKLFSKFYRAGNARQARPDGTGLGLFMAKKVIVAQGGAIVFKSEEGKGSTFGFSFPKAKLLAAKPVANHK